MALPPFSQKFHPPRKFQFSPNIYGIKNALEWLGIASLNGSSHTATPKHLFRANVIKDFENLQIMWHDR